MAATLVRPRRGKIFAGVCAALADRFEVPRAFVRVGFMFFGLFGVGEFVYIALWILIPRDELSLHGQDCRTEHSCHHWN